MKKSNDSSGFYLIEFIAYSVSLPLCLFCVGYAIYDLIVRFNEPLDWKLVWRLMFLIAALDWLVSWVRFLWEEWKHR